MRVVEMANAGEAQVMRVVERPDPTPTPGQVLVAVAAAGVNFMDVGVRRGVLWTDTPSPKALGVEGAGEVLAIGEGVTDVRVGDRVAWVYAPGSYADRAVVPASALVILPDGIDDRTAASVMMQGLTASHFATNFYPVQRGDIALVHAAAGGVGQLLTQIIKLRGGTVIGRVSAAEKVAAARAAGADHVIVDRHGGFAQEAVRLSGGEGVHVVFDGSGPVTFEPSLASLRRCGTFCWYGPVLGASTSLDIMRLPRSIKIGYAVFADGVATPDALRARAAELFAWILAGKIKVAPARTFTLAGAVEAHRQLESRSTTGKLLLVP